MSKKIEDILAQCIEDVKAGRSSIRDCLDKYPSMRKQLEPLLRIALEIQEPPDIKPSPAFKVRARVQLMEQIHAGQSVTKWPWSRYINQMKPILYRKRFSMIATIVAVVLAVSALGGGAAYASQGSLPGDVLYPVKLGTEQARLVVTPSDLSKAELHLTFANRRVEEMVALAEEGQSEKVNMAVNGYDRAIGMAIGKIDEARGKGLDAANISELVAVATSNHLSVLDRVMDIMTIVPVPEEAIDAISHATEVSINGYKNALIGLAGENPVRAMEINLAAMEGRLNRARVKAENNDIEAMEAALAQFQALNEFGEEISAIARRLGKDTVALDELLAKATAIHLDILAEVYEKVLEQAREAIEKAIAASGLGPPDDVGPPGDVGPPDDAGPPEELPIPGGDGFRR